MIMMLPTFKNFQTNGLRMGEIILKNRFGDIIYISKDRYKVLWRQRERRRGRRE